MFEQVQIAPSILSANFMNLGSDVERLERAGAGMIHVDVMDGHFVPNLSMGVPVVKQLAKTTSLPLDVHLMISNPLYQLPWFLEAGANLVTLHIEALQGEEEVRTAYEMAHSAGVKFALSVKPKTPVSEIAPYISLLDMVLIMSVEPGFSGQSYIEGSDTKVAEVVQIAQSAGVSPLIQVDGGIGLKTAPMVSAAGADVLVCGNAVCGAPDPEHALHEILNVAESARKEALQ